MSDEIRTIGDKKYKIVKEPCHCMCHRFPEGTVKHCMPCCRNGFKEYLVEIIEKIEKRMIMRLHFYTLQIIYLFRNY